MNWYANLRKLVLGRQTWRAEDEYAYYGVDARVVKEHAQRQIQFADECYYSGLQIARSMQILDSLLIIGKSILEIGAGESLLAQAMLSCGARRVIAVDAIPKQIWAAALFNRGNQGMECVIAEASRLPYEDCSFDIIAGNLILHHIEPLAPVIKEVGRLLAPGGTFVAIEPTPLMGALIHHTTSRNEAPIWPTKVKKALLYAGFEHVSAKYWWGRLQTSQLGFMSPGYVVRGRAPGLPTQASVRLSRPLVGSGIPGLLMDSECPFRNLVAMQVQELREIWQRIDKPADWVNRFRPW